MEAEIKHETEEAMRAALKQRGSSGSKDRKSRMLALKEISVEHSCWLSIYSHCARYTAAGSVYTATVRAYSPAA